MLACRVTIAADGALGEDIQFFAAEIESKAKLVYDEVSDWLEGIAGWQPPSDAIAQQITLLKRVCDARNAWRHRHALVFKDRPDYRFVLGEKGDVLEIVTEQRRSANRIVEECMIAANVCAAVVLRDRWASACTTCTPVSILLSSSKRSPYCRPTVWKPKPRSC